MFRVALISMPFSAVRLPSIALTQLRSVLRSSLGERVDTRVFYFNQEFARFMGTDGYAKISDSSQATVTGVGEWLFRRVAFPDAEDNAKQFFARYGFQLRHHKELLESYEAVRDGLEGFIDELIDRHGLADYELVGLTSMFAQNVASFAMARKLKSRNPDIVTVMGGANCETTMGSVIARNVSAVDFVCSGPALKSFPELVRRLADGDRENCHEIHGILSATTAVLDERAIGDELDLEIEVPLDYQDFLESLSEHCPEAHPSLLFETSRGCWWGERSHCTFCGLNGTTMQYRSMSPEKALAQFEDLFSHYPKVKRYESVDNILPREYLTKVLPKLNPPEDVAIFYELKADLKDDEMRILAEAGVTQIQPGIEALATSTLKLMGKGTTAFNNIRFLKDALIYGIDPGWNLLIGFPGEGEEVYGKYVEDLPLLTHLPPPSGVYPVRFDRFSPYHTRAKEFGLDLRPMDFYELVYPFPKSDLNDLAYFFDDRNYDSEYVRNTAKWVKKLESAVNDWGDKWSTHDTGTNRWHGGAAASHPVLTPSARDNSGIRLLDTRSGKTVEHTLDANETALLEALDKPMRLDRIESEFPHLPEATVEDVLVSVRERGLVFEEGGRAMSLVVNTGRDTGVI